MHVPPPGYLTATEVGRIFGVGMSAVQRWRLAGKIPAEATRRIGRQTFYHHLAILRLAEGLLPDETDSRLSGSIDEQS